MLWVMDSGQGSLSELRDQLSASSQQAFVRAALERSDGTWTARHVDAIIGPPDTPAGWEERGWEYANIAFVAAEVSSTALAAALDGDGARTLRLGGYDLAFPVLQESLRWQRRPSRARFEWVTLPWPARICDLNERDHATRGSPSDFLIGDDCPSFATYEAAFRAFLYDDFSASPGGRQVPSEFAVIRVVEHAAWLEHVRITPVDLQVQVAGSEVVGARLELNSESYRADTRISEPGSIRLPLPSGLPPGAWLYLSRGKHWLDYRPIGDYRSPAELAHAGIDVEFPEDPVSELQALLSAGEWQRAEFKRQLPDGSDDSKRTVFKTVAAFANGDGGTIVFGVEKDEATVCGLDSADPRKDRDRLIQLVRSTVVPAPDVDVRHHDLDGKILLVLTVPRGASPPYGITLPGKKDKPVEFYVRRGATTFPASPDEIRAAVLATVPPQPSGPPWLFPISSGRW
jgi:hypothetical protein